MRVMVIAEGRGIDALRRGRRRGRQHDEIASAAALGSQASLPAAWGDFLCRAGRLAVA